MGRAGSVGRAGSMGPPALQGALSSCRAQHRAGQCSPCSRLQCKVYCPVSSLVSVSYLAEGEASIQSQFTAEALFLFLKHLEMKNPLWHSSTLEREPGLLSGQAALLWLSWVDPGLGHFSISSRSGVLAFFQQPHELPMLSAGLVLTPCVSHSGMSPRGTQGVLCPSPAQGHL